MFKYKDFVRVSEGFIEGMYGVLVGVSHSGQGFFNYNIKFYDTSDHVTHIIKEIPEFHLEKVELPKEAGNFVYNLTNDGWKLTDPLRQMNFTSAPPEFVFSSVAPEIFKRIHDFMSLGGTFKQVDQILFTSMAKANYALRGIQKDQPYPQDEEVPMPTEKSLQSLMEELDKNLESLSKNLSAT